MTFANIQASQNTIKATITSNASIGVTKSKSPRDLSLDIINDAIPKVVNNIATQTGICNINQHLQF